MLLKMQKRISTVNDENSDYQDLQCGHLVMMKCGHRGLPYRLEEKRISRLLRKSGFIPKLEDAPNFKHNFENVNALSVDMAVSQLPLITPKREEFNENKLSAKKEVSRSH